MTSSFRPQVKLSQQVVRKTTYIYSEWAIIFFFHETFVANQLK